VLAQVAEHLLRGRGGLDVGPAAGAAPSGCSPARSWCRAGRCGRSLSSRM
jgi:hypothetical protein